MPDQLQLRGGTTTEHNSFTCAAREVTVDTTKKTLVVHDGSQAGGTPLMKESGGNAASAVSIGTGGTNAIHIDSSQRVGLSTVTPQAKLHVKVAASGGATANTQAAVILESNNNQYIQFQSPNNKENGFLFGDDADNNVGFIIYNHNNNNLAFGANAAERARIDSSGSLLVGGTSSVGANYRLQAFHSTDCRMALANTTAASSQEVNLQFLPANSVTGALITCIAEEDFSTTANRTASLTFTTRKDGTLAEAMRIDSAGRVGIGTNSPSTVLHIADSDAELTLERTGTHSTSNSPLIQFKGRGPNATMYNFAKIDAVSTGSNNAGHLRFYTNASGTQSERMRIDSSGNVGIAGTAPNYTLHVNGTIGVGANGFAQQLTIGNNAIQSLLLGTGYTNMSINALGGNVGIGTSSALARLHVVNGSSGDGTIQLGGTNTSAAGQLFYELSGSTYLRIKNLYRSNSSNGNSAYIEYDAGYHKFLSGTGGSERLRIDSSGNLLHGVTSSENTTGNTGTKFITAGDIQIDGDQKVLLFRSANSTAQKQSGIQWWNENGAGVQCAIFGIRETTTLAKGALAFYTSDNVDTASNNSEGNITEAMRIDSSQNVHIGRTDTMDFGANNVLGINLLADGLIQTSKSNSPSLLVCRQGSTGSVVQFANQGTANVGSISVTTTGTAYNTSASDRTLKKNFENWTESTLTLFKNINPQKFNFIQEEDTDAKHKGYIAQDLINSFPEAYNKNDNDKYMFNPSGMVVYLMKAIQELEAKVAALEAA